MPLQRQLVTVPFQAGVDTRSDPKVGDPVRLSVLENGVWAKKNVVRSRFGYDTLTRNIGVGGSLSSGNSAHSYGDELLQVSAKNLYGFADENNAWVSHGELPSVGWSTKNVIQNQFGQGFQDSATTGNVELYVWIDTRNRSVRASVYDKTGDMFTIVDAEIFNQANGYAYTPNVRAVAIGQYLFVIYSDGSNLKGKRIDSNNPYAFGSEFTLASDLNITNTFLIQGRGFDIVEYDSGAAVFCYVKTANTEMGVAYLKSDQAIGNGGNGYAAPVTVTDRFETNSMQVIKQADGRVWVVYIDEYDAISSPTQGAYYFVRNADLTAAIAPAPISTATSPLYSRIGCVWETSTSLRVFLDKGGAGAPRITTVTVSSTGTVGATSLYLINARLASHPFIFTSVVYVNVLLGQYNNQTAFSTNPTYVSPQNVLVTLRYADYAVMAKFFQGQADICPTQVVMDVDGGQATNLLFCLPRVNIPLASTFQWPLLVQQSGFDKLGAVLFGNEAPNDRVGIVRCEVSFVAEPLTLSKKTGKSIHLLPGQLSEYDGAEVSELGFIQYPDGVSAASQTTSGFSSAVFQQGTGALPEIKDITCALASRLAPNNYIAIPNAAGVNKTFGFIVNGEGNQALFDGFCAVSSEDLASTVATALKNAIDAHADFIATNPSANVVRVTNAANGNVTDTVIIAIGSTSIVAGNYFYRVIYSWSDINGEIHRSAPSQILSVTIASTSYVTITIPTLYITKKKSPNSPISIEVYRTTSNGTIFYKLPRLILSGFGFLGTLIYEQTQLQNITSQTTVVYQDNTVDADIVDNEILYTQGGVVDNIMPPSANCFAYGANRMLVSGFSEKPNQIWISKQKFDGEGVAFNDSFIIDIDAFGGPNRALEFFDDKFIVFQDSAMLWFIGQGPDDLGFGQNFTDPQYISKDIGCPYPQSIAILPIGLVFKSEKGWWMIDHRLSLIYIGEDVQDYNSLVPSSAVVLKDSHQVRWTHTTGQTLVYDYVMNAWSVFTSAVLTDVVGATVWKGLYTLLKSDGKAYVENHLSFQEDAVGINMAIETMFISFAGVAGMQRVYKFLPLGTFDPDYTYTLTYKMDYNEAVIGIVEFVPVSTEELFRAFPQVQKCYAVKVRIVVTGDGNAASEFAGITFEIGAKRGASKLSAALSRGGPAD